MTVVSNS